MHASVGSMLCWCHCVSCHYPPNLPVCLLPAYSNMVIFLTLSSHPIFLPNSHLLAAYRPLAPGQYKLTAIHPLFSPMSADITIPEDDSGAIQDFKLTPLPGADTADWEEGMTMSTHTLLKHVVLRTHHVALLAIMGLMLCGIGGWTLLRSTHGKLPGMGQLVGRRREYEMVSTANGAERV